LVGWNLRKHLEIACSQRSCAAANGGRNGKPMCPAPLHSHHRACFDVIDVPTSMSTNFATLDPAKLVRQAFN